MSTARVDTATHDHGLRTADRADALHGAVLDSTGLDRLMPMHLLLDAAGRIISAGPTLHRLGGPLVGRFVADEFVLRRPRGMQDLTAMDAGARARLRLAPRAHPQTWMKGQAIMLAAQSVEAPRWLLNLSFGINLVGAVRAHRLCDADFAPTDLAVEMLYLVEANAAVRDALRNTNERLRRAKANAEEQALTDPLTGLRNRRALSAQLGKYLGTGTTFGMVQLDLDHFKRVNDTLGHAAGDHVLSVVAQILTTGTRSCDTVARTGGDEFVVLCPGIDRIARLEQITARIIDRIAHPIGWEGQLITISASAGVLVSRENAPPTADALLSRADQALYTAKRVGRGRMHRAGAAP